MALVKRISLMSQIELTGYGARTATKNRKALQEEMQSRYEARLATMQDQILLALLKTKFKNLRQIRNFFEFKKWDWDAGLFLESIYSLQSGNFVIVNNHNVLLTEWRRLTKEEEKLINGRVEPTALETRRNWVKDTHSQSKQAKIKRQEAERPFQE